MIIHSFTDNKNLQDMLWHLAERFPPGIGDGTNSNYNLCVTEPKSAMCKQCGSLKRSWYPQPPPAVKLYVAVEVLETFLLGPFIIHEQLFDVLRPYWPDAVFTRCTSHPESPLPIGDKYLSIGLPARYYTSLRVPIQGAAGYCDLCGATGGWPHAQAYHYLRDDQRGIRAFCTERTFLAVTEDLKVEISMKLSEFAFDWRCFEVRPEPLPYHRIPEDGLGPAAPSPFPPPPKLPNAPRQPKKKRGGLS